MLKPEHTRVLSGLLRHCVLLCVREDAMTSELTSFRSPSRSKQGSVHRRCNCLFYLYFTRIHHEDLSKPEFFLGPQAQSLAGSSASPHYIFLDAAAINNLHTVFPLAPSKPQAALLSSLFRVSENRRIVLATTPIELMLLDHIKENPEDGDVQKPKLRELASLGRGGLAVQSYASMRSSWYSYQPFTLTDVST